MKKIEFDINENNKLFFSIDGSTFEDNINRVYTDGKYMYSDGSMLLGCSIAFNILTIIFGATNQMVVIFGGITFSFIIAGMITLLKKNKK
jgi:hypothetical protein